MITIPDIFGWLLFAMLLLRFLVTVFNYLSRPYLPKRTHNMNCPTVSVLIPARNEANTLPDLLADLKNIDYPNVEIIVCNDHSVDGTMKVLEDHQSILPNLTHFTNDNLPPGWVGKNFACFQLAQRASGDYFLFLDADVRLKPDAIAKAVDYASKNQLALLSVFPQQIIGTRGEWDTVPLMNWILLTMLPLKAVRIPWFRSLSAANGQFMLFKGDVYHNNQWHKKVWNKNVEDILIARLMKGARLRIAVLTGRDDIMCRMYQSKEEALSGFSRNIHHYFSGSRLWMSLFVSLALFRLPMFAILQQWWLFSVTIFMVLIMKVLVARISIQSVWENIIHHFAQLWALVQLTWRNFAMSGKRKLEWKGRVYDI